MKNSFFTASLVLCCWACLSTASESHAQFLLGAISNGQIVRRSAEPAWAPNIIATPVQRYQLSQMPIQSRPYRPLHIYGNTIRRSYYRGNPLPMPRDILQEVIPPIARVARVGRVIRR